MSLLRKWFPPKSEVWRPFCEELGGEYSEGNLWNADAVEFSFENIPIKLTAEGDSETPGHYQTLMRSTIRTNGDFMLGILRNWPAQGVYNLLVTLFGLQKVEMSQLVAGTEATVLTKDVAKAKAVLDNPQLQNLINEQSQLMLFVGQFPKLSSTRGGKVPEVVLSVPDVIDDLEQLQKVLRLHEKVLERLFATGAASCDSSE
jgi:hypothetical protein